MTGLLISVRSRAEAERAVRGGADIIDVKEPDLGSLGRAESGVLREVSRAVADRVTLSAALGELIDADDLDLGCLEGFRFGKFGLSGCGHDRNWLNRWRLAIQRLPAGVSPVAVIYADWQAADAPSPAEVIEAAASAACRFVLLDTFHKTASDLFQHCSPRQLAQLVFQCRERKMGVVLAGSLQLQRLPSALDLAPDYVAVRGAVCRGSRRGELDTELVEAWKSAIQAQRPSSELIRPFDRDGLCVGETSG